jgi:hypothetical protein
MTLPKAPVPIVVPIRPEEDIQNLGRGALFVVPPLNVETFNVDVCKTVVKVLYDTIDDVLIVENLAFEEVVAKDDILEA